MLFMQRITACVLVRVRCSSLLMYWHISPKFPPTRVLRIRRQESNSCTKLGMWNQGYDCPYCVLLRLRHNGFTLPADNYKSKKYEDRNTDEPKHSDKNHAENTPLGKGGAGVIEAR